jgi:L-2-hydroxyglutarate oxidase LhgO
MVKTDYLIIGAGIIGMTVARAIKQRRMDASIIVIDKEDDVAAHASGRNSGVLHAGFYYTADSMKARFTVNGNRAWKAYCESKSLPVNACGKLVVADNAEELEQLYELERRGKKNGSRVEIIDEACAHEFEPALRTYKKALYSPDTASVDPVAVCLQLKADLEELGVEFWMKSGYRSRRENIVVTDKGEIEAGFIVNCAGLYADKIAHAFGFGLGYTLMPFKGLYLKYTKNKTDVRMNIYPVPNLNNPFLGVHFTKTVDGGIKIGPTAIPAFWRENYQGRDNFRFNELTEICLHQSRLWLTNSFNFRALAREEIRKYQKDHFVALAQKMVPSIDPAGFTEFTRPGIRAQLLDRKTLKLVQDFVVEGDKHSCHILNAVSPAFTCAPPFAEYVVTNFIPVR